MRSTTLAFERIFPRYVLVICTFAMFVAISMYAYLGTFSRYRADDYCEAVRVTADPPIRAVIERYSAGATRASNRYSNLLFEGFSEMLGDNNMLITIVAMVLLWVIGLSWSAHEIRKFLKIEWLTSLDIFWGTTLGFFSLLLAPNLFQTIYWRSSMMTHFAPLVFGSFLCAFVVRQLRRLRIEPPSRPVYAVVFFAAFIIAGFSEPPTTTMVTTLPLLVASIWFWGKPPAKQKQLAVLAWMFAGVFLGLMVMIFSPAAANVAREEHLDVVFILGKSFLYSYQFISDSLKTIPLPAALSALLSFMLVWLYKQTEPVLLSQNGLRIVLLGILATPIFMWLLIAAGFAPSVYGQNYPIERMRFLARTILIFTFMLEGAFLGLLLKDTHFKFNQVLGQWAVLVLFATLAIVYPLRAAINVYKVDVPEYRANAETWDVRDAQIRLAVEQGATDLVVVQLDSWGGAVEYKGNPLSWVNLCAAQYYGLNTLIAP